MLGGMCSEPASLAGAAERHLVNWGCGDDTWAPGASDLAPRNEGPGRSRALVAGAAGFGGMEGQCREWSQGMP